jgi:hypothetical protein
MSAVTQRIVYLYVLNDCGGSLSSSGRPSLAAMIARGIGSDDEVWVRVILEELVDLGVIRVRDNRNVEVTQTVDAMTLDNSDLDDEEDLTVDEAAATATAGTQPMKEEGLGAPSTDATPSIMAASSRPVTQPGPQVPDEPEAYVRWQTASGKRAVWEYPEAKEIARLRKRVARLEQLNHSLVHRLDEAVARRDHAEERVRQAESWKTNERAGLRNQVMALRIQLYYAVRIAAVELASIKGQLANACGLIAHQERDLADAQSRADVPSEELALEVTKLTDKCRSLAQAKARFQTQVSELKGALSLAQRDAAAYMDEIHRMRERLEPFREVMEMVRKASKRPTRLSCGHSVVVMATSKEHQPGFNISCPRVEVVEIGPGPQQALTEALPPDLPAGFRRGPRK